MDKSIVSPFFLTHGVYLYVDDAKLFKHILYDTDCLILQMDINNMSDWMNRWLLKLNVEKCKVVSYGREY